MPLLSEIARITGGRIIVKDALPEAWAAEVGHERWDVLVNGVTRKEFSGPTAEKDAKKFLSEMTGVTKDGVLSDLVGLAKKAGEALMEPTEKAAAGDTEDADTTVWKCNECDKTFKKDVLPKTTEIKCPSCGSEDIDLLGHTKDGGPGSGVKGHTTPQDIARGKVEKEIESIESRYSHPDDMPSAVAKKWRELSDEWHRLAGSQSAMSQIKRSVAKR